MGVLAWCLIRLINSKLMIFNDHNIYNNGEKYELIIIIINVCSSADNNFINNNFNKK